MELLRLFIAVFEGEISASRSRFGCRVSYCSRLEAKVERSVESASTDCTRTLPFLVVLAATAWFVLHHTRYGRWTFAIGVNAEAARFSGIPVERTKLMLFAMTGLMAGVAGVVYTLRFASASPDGA